MTVRRRAPEDVDAKTRELLARRAERLRATPDVVADSRVEWVAEFPVGDDRFAIPLSVLRAVVPLRRVTPVPRSLPHVVGIMRFQGQVITALSMAALLGVKGWRQDPAVLVVIDPGWGRLVAVDCEEVPRPLSIAASAVNESQRRGSSPIAEVIHEGRIVHLLDLGRLLDRRTGGRSE